MSQGELSLRSQRGHGSFVLAPVSPEWPGCRQVRGASWGEAGLFYLQLPCVYPHSRLASARCFTSLFHSCPSFALWGPPEHGLGGGGKAPGSGDGVEVTSLALFFRSALVALTPPPPQGHRVVVRALTLASTPIP